jgi:hypothetical protein
MRKERQMSAYKKILELTPGMASTISRLRNAERDDDEDIRDSVLFKFIELVSVMIFLHRSSC